MARPSSVPVGLEVNRSELAEYLGVALSTIDNWRRAGCPVIKASKGAVQFNTADVIAWLCERERKQVLAGRC